MSNYETEQEILKTDDGFSEKKMALTMEKVLVQIPNTKPKQHKKTKQEENVIYEEK